MDFHHPIFRSVVLPLVLSFGVAALLRAALGAERGRRWAAAGVPIAIVVAAIWLLGWKMQPGTLIEEYPWIFLASALLGLGLEAMQATLRTTWLAGIALWALVLVGLSEQAIELQVVTWIIGIVVIAAVSSPPAESAYAATSLVIASLGLAGVALVGGSALLFEVGLSIAAAVGGCALWLWPRVRIAFGACGTVASVVAWLAVAQGVALLSPVHPLALVLLAGSLLSAPIVQGAARLLRPAASASRPSRAWVGTLVVAVLSTIWVAGAIVVAHRTSAPTQAGPADNPYYTPRW